jgi:hypothetical protein
LRIGAGLRQTPRDDTTGVRRGVPLNRGASRREKRRPARFFRRFEPFQAVADRKISPPLIRQPADFPRTAPRTDAVSQLLSDRRDGRCTGVLRTGRIWRYSNSVSFVFKGLRGGNFRPFPAGAAIPTLGPLRRAREGGHSGDRARRCDGGPRSGWSVVRPRRSATNALGRWTLGSTAAGPTCGSSVSGRAWPQRVLFIGDRTKRIA